jgi:hypothetical protein
VVDLRFTREYAFCVSVEGSADALRRAGVLRPDDETPRGLGGCINRGLFLVEGGYQITALKDGTLRVSGRSLEAAKADVAFRRFLAALVAQVGDRGA